MLPVLTVLILLGGGWVTTDHLTGPRVLVIGDSHVNGSFGLELHRTLRERLDGAVVTVVGSCGRWSKDWVQGARAHCGIRWIEGEGRVRWGAGCSRNPCEAGDEDCLAHPCRNPPIARLLAAHRPDLTIVQLGGNSIFRGSRRDRWEKVAMWVDPLVDAIGDAGSACLWVSPPHGLNRSAWRLERFAHFLATRTRGRCRVYDSGPTARPWLDYSKAVAEAGPLAAAQDRIHYDRLGRAGRRRMARWAREVASTGQRLLEAADDSSPGLLAGLSWGQAGFEQP